MKWRFITAVYCASTLIIAAAAWDLPPGVPNPIAPDGTHTDAIRFTTDAYRKEAFRLLLEEANAVAKDLELAEGLPITESEIVSRFISPFGDAYANRRIGNITTSKYSYGVEADYKFNDLARTHMDALCFEYQQKYRISIKQIDTNAAYQLTTQFLARLQVDVQALDRECQVAVKPSDFWNGVAPGAKLTAKTFVPIYNVSWISPNKAKNFGVAASVQVFAPTKTLLQLSIDEPKYLCRKPLVFTNLAELLSTTNRPAAAKANFPGGESKPARSD
jgi:hypothetical protein